MEAGSAKPVTVAGKPQIPLVRPDLASKRVEGAPTTHFEPKVVFLGLIALQDPPRPAVPRAVQVCRQASIGVVMVTGDQPQTAAAIARDIGIIAKNGRTEEDVILAKLLCMSRKEGRREGRLEQPDRATHTTHNHPQTQLSRARRART